MSIWKNVKITSCDNAGKIKALEDDRDNNSKDINFKFTSPGTPQKMRWYNRYLIQFTSICAQ